MRTLITVLCLSLLSLTSGCSSKAPKGQGGIAEHHYGQSANHPVGLEDALYFEEQMTARHFDALVAAGAKICFPASIKKIQIRQARIIRQLAGGLKADAANDLIIQRDQLSRLERRLNYVQMQDSCLPNQPYNGSQSGNLAQLSGSNQLDNTDKKLSAVQLEQLLALFNNNNQFVSNSAQLNPRYIGQLSEASHILRDYPQYQLKITGHTDSIGSQADNLKLSLARAAQVERYLLIFGINPNNISVNGSGESEPLFKQPLPQVRLVNRRVTIELIEHNLTGQK